MTYIAKTATVTTDFTGTGTGYSEDSVINGLVIGFRYVPGTFDATAEFEIRTETTKAVIFRGSLPQDTVVPMAIVHDSSGNILNTEEFTFNALIPIVDERIEIIAIDLTGPDKEGSFVFLIAQYGYGFEEPEEE